MASFKRYSRVFAKVIVALGTAVILSSPVHALEIRVKSQATVTGDTVSLADIASFFPETDARVARLSGINVTSSPAPGNSFRLNGHFLNYKIGSALGEDDGIQLKVPDSLWIQRTAQEITEGDLEKIFKEHVKGRSPWPAEKIVFERISTPGTIFLPQGTVQWEVAEKGDLRNLGHVALTVSFLVEGRQVRKVALSGKVGVVREVVKAEKQIEAGALISEDDLILVREERSHLRRDAATSLEDVVGKRATRHIRPDQVILSRMIEDLPLVRKGKQVVIRAQKALIRVTTLGKVMEDGRAGDQVRVINISSGKQVLATVKGPGLVEVRF